MSAEQTEKIRNSLLLFICFVAFSACITHRQSCFLSLLLVTSHFLMWIYYRRLPMSTTEEPKTEGKKAGKDAPPVSIGWDSHKPVVRVKMEACRCVVGWFLCGGSTGLFHTEPSHLWIVASHCCKTPPFVLTYVFCCCFSFPLWYFIIPDE